MGRHLLAASILLAADLLSGCVTPIKLATPPAQEVMIEPGKLTVNGISQSQPWDCWYSFSDGKLVPHPSGFRLEPVIGADLIGLQGSPWAGLRWFHLENVGVNAGFDKSDFTTGVDWLYHDISIGPGVAFPFDLSPSKFCLTAGFIF